MKRTSVEFVVRSRRGLALGLVILLALVILGIGTVMIGNSGDYLKSSVDSKARLRARYAAEGMVAIQMAKLDALKDQAMGASLVLPQVPLTALNTGDGEKAQSDPLKLAIPRGQETINSGLFRGMKGVKIPFLIQATGVTPGGGKAKIDADVYLYQVPIFQFGVFYEHDLEIAPGPDMTVLGPVHTNGNAFFRGYANRTLTFQGPVSVGKTLYHWAQNNGKIVYYKQPSTSSGALALGSASLGTAMVALTDATRPAAVGGVHNVQDGANILKLPIGGADPRQLILPCSGTESEGLKKQKFACLPGVNTYIEGTTPVPTWLSAQKAFFDRREDRWVKFRDFDVAAAMAANPDDSIFYLYDDVSVIDKGAKKSAMINAFRLVNGQNLSRNVSIATGNPVYVLGDFNLPWANSPCKPADVSGSVDVSERYCNVMIASDAITLLSSRWTESDYASRGMDGTLEQPFSNASWTATRWWDSIPQFFTYSNTPTAPATRVRSNTEQTWGIADTFHRGTYPATITLNAAVLTGSKSTASAFLPPNNYTDFTYNWNNEGGWIGTLRFLEDLGGWTELPNWWRVPPMNTMPQWVGYVPTDRPGTTVVFKGSFVCLWNSATPGLDMSTNITFATGSMRQDRPASVAARAVVSRPNGLGYFAPPKRVWGYDERFRNINNMPPGTPFLSTGIFANWAER